jgi:transposase
LDKAEVIAILGKWEGYELESGRRTADETEVELRLKVTNDGKHMCSGCGGTVTAVHETTWREVRDLPILGARTVIRVPRRRVLCAQCGPKLERLSWLEPYARVTNRLAESVARLCSVLPVKHVAEHFGLGWQTVKEIDKAWLKGTLGPIDFSGVTMLVMDEFAIQKGHRYATVVADARTKRVLWVGRGRSRKEIRAFFELLGEQRGRQIVAVAIDMNTAYELEIRDHCPNARIVYDLFHVVAKYGREVIDRVRVDEANRLRHDKPARKVVKSSRWILLRNRENIRNEEDLVKLDELLQANEALTTVYILKDDLKRLWSYRQEEWARKFWQQWYNRAIASKIAPLVEFATKLKVYLHGILAHCRWNLHTSVIEGINNKIKVIKRMAYGFRDDEYFFLKIRAAFPGIP